MEQREAFIGECRVIEVEKFERSEAGEVRDGIIVDACAGGFEAGEVGEGC